jgi:hypothetical protein
MFAFELCQYASRRQVSSLIYVDDLWTEHSDIRGAWLGYF